MLNRSVRSICLLASISKERRAGGGGPALLSLNLFMIQSTDVLIKIAQGRESVDQRNRKGRGWVEGKTERKENENK
jgi:hypothetical protein